MNRRAVGATLLLLGVLVATVIPRLDAAEIAGTPSMAPVQQPPTVGSCVLGNPQAAGRPSGALAVLAYEGCDRPHYGEVVQVFDQYQQFPGIGSDQVNGPDPAGCIPAANSCLAVDRMVPLNHRGDRGSSDFAAWQPVATGSVGVIGPSIAQQLDGQQWLACVTLGRTSFSGSVRGAFAGGTLPDSYTVCGDLLLTSNRIDCGDHITRKCSPTPDTSTICPRRRR